ncbi:hypothetical protein [Serratia liquefaciens]|uniref:hypothetical protein n=1 Tax=Serratia liquefaciens TaxID=614 RepID=UPI0022DD1C50|nr:hypothetical protein [Serratia liquefaciens]WBL70582.1 hypothetical protein LQ945_13115 [Serratia liquefaciens]
MWKRIGFFTPAIRDAGSFRYLITILIEIHHKFLWWFGIENADEQAISGDKPKERGRGGIRRTYGLALFLQ